MKPMIFQVEEPFEYLKRRGRVTSARSKPREEGEEVWIRKTRTGPKEFEARVKEVVEINWVDERNLVGHLHDHDLICGFKNGYQWFKKIDELHDDIPNPLYIHVVERKSEAQNDMRVRDMSETSTEDGE